MNTDAELLRRFVEDHSEAAFTELVQRHLALVRSTALRRVGGDAHAADDVTQQVFVALARKAPALRGHGALPGWLYLSPHHATASWVRREQRRKQREAAAHSMQLIDSSSDSAVDAARIADFHRHLAGNGAAWHEIATPPRCAAAGTSFPAVVQRK